MPLSLNEIRDRARAFAHEWAGCRPSTDFEVNHSGYFHQ